MCATLSASWLHAAHFSCACASSARSLPFSLVSCATVSVSVGMGIVLACCMHCGVASMAIDVPPDRAKAKSISPGGGGPSWLVAGVAGSGIALTVGLQGCAIIVNHAVPRKWRWCAVLFMLAVPLGWGRSLFWSCPAAPNLCSSS
jgi:hypothetical protein